MFKKVVQSYSGTQNIKITLFIDSYGPEFSVFRVQMPFGFMLILTLLMLLSQFRIMEKLPSGLVLGPRLILLGIESGVIVGQGSLVNAAALLECWYLALIAFALPLFNTQFFACSLVWSTLALGIPVSAISLCFMSNCAYLQVTLIMTACLIVVSTTRLKLHYYVPNLEIFDKLIPAEQTRRDTMLLYMLSGAH